MITWEPSPAESPPQARARYPGVQDLHHRMRFQVLSLVALWMLAIAALNLWWAHHLISAESRHHMLDQALALARQLELFTDAGLAPSDALSQIADWPGRFHELDLEDARGGLLASTQMDARPGRPAEGDDTSAVLVPIRIGPNDCKLRLWMIPHRLSSHYRDMLAANLAVSLSAGIVLTLLIGVATTRAARRYDALLLAIEKLEDQDARTKQLELMGKLAAGLAHEVRNPLNALGLGLQRIRSELVPECGQHGKVWGPAVGLLYAEVRRLDKVVEEFLSMARTPSLALDAFDLGAFVSELPQLYADEMRQAGVQVELKSPSGSHTMEADREKVRQVMVNLLRNALEAVPSSQPRVQVVASCSPDAHILEVRDNGPGFKVEDTEKVFEVFYTSKRQGTGLGLPIARRIVEAHGGTLDCRREGEWTVFTVRLPKRRGLLCSAPA